MDKQSQKIAHFSSQSQQSGEKPFVMLPKLLCKVVDAIEKNVVCTDVGCQDSVA